MGVMKQLFFYYGKFINSLMIIGGFHKFILQKSYLR